MGAFFFKNWISKCLFPLLSRPSWALLQLSR